VKNCAIDLLLCDGSKKRGRRKHVRYLVKERRKKKEERRKKKGERRRKKKQLTGRSISVTGFTNFSV
jgi:hypothetical protein